MWCPYIAQTICSDISSQGTSIDSIRHQKPTNYWPFYNRTIACAIIEIERKANFTWSLGWCQIAKLRLPNCTCIALSSFLVVCCRCSASVGNIFWNCLTQQHFNGKMAKHGQNSHLWPSGHETNCDKCWVSCLVFLRAHSCMTKSHPLIVSAVFRPYLFLLVTQL